MTLYIALKGPVRVLLSVYDNFKAMEERNIGHHVVYG